MTRKILAQIILCTSSPVLQTITGVTYFISVYIHVKRISRYTAHGELIDEIWAEFDYTAVYISNCNWVLSFTFSMPLFSSRWIVDAMEERERQKKRECILMYNFKKEKISYFE